MPVLSAKNTCLFSLIFIGGIIVSCQSAWAVDLDFLGRLSPRISLNKKAPAQQLQAFSVNAPPQVGAYLEQGESYSPQAMKSMSDQDPFSLALGARFKISEWLGVDATCAMPLAEEETVWKKDLAIEAMVTMQF